MTTRIAIVSDLHGNSAATEAVLAAIDLEAPDAVSCLGDLVGYGAKPNETIALIRGRGIPTVMGNYDDGVGFDRDDCGCAYTDAGERERGQQSLLWTCAVTTPQHKAYLRTLLPEIRFEAEGTRFRLVHGSPRRMNEYLFEDRDPRSLARIAQNAEADVLVFGHTHQPWVREIAGVLFLNAGSVGKPKDGDPRAAWALLTVEPGRPVQIAIRRVPYDVASMATAIRATAGLPDQFAADIERGGTPSAAGHRAREAPRLRRGSESEGQRMEPHICVTCGAQFSATTEPPARCPICADERQYIGHEGQRWTTLAELGRDHRNQIAAIADGLTGIVTEPRFAIGQQAHLIATPAGNVLWNCISFIDDETVTEIERRGGLAAIAVSHPHFFTGVAAWSQAFGGAPIFLHADDQQWVTRPDDAIHFWQGETAQPLPGSGLTLIRCGGHFPGSCVLHWPHGGGGGALLTGDTIMVVSDRRWVSFMYSYPNLIPLAADAIRRIVAAVEPFQFDRIYGAWPESVVASDAKHAVRRSSQRYLDHIVASGPD